MTYFPQQAEKGPVSMTKLVLLLIGIAVYAVSPRAGLAADQADSQSIVSELTPVTGDEETPPAIDLYITFALNSAELTPAARSQLDILAEALRDPRFVTSEFGVYGHTDASGSAAYNLGLSQRRAAAVLTYLVQHRGFDAARLKPQGFGETSLKDPANPNAGINRRVEIVNLTPNRTRAVLQSTQESEQPAETESGGGGGLQAIE